MARDREVVAPLKTYEEIVAEGDRQRKEMRERKANRRKSAIGDAQVCVRLPKRNKERADALINATYDAIQVKTGIPMKGWGISDVLRMAIERGLESLEKEYAPKTD